MKIADFILKKISRLVDNLGTCAREAYNWVTRSSVYYNIMPLSDSDSLEALERTWGYFRIIMKLY